MIKYGWTGENDHIQFSTDYSIAVGGGDGHFGLRLTEDFLKGKSSPCPTFANEGLSSTDEFTCVNIEVWGLDI